MTTTITAEGTEELFIPPEVANGEGISQPEIGFLPGCNGKFHTCLLHPPHPFSQKCTTLLSKVSHPKTDQKTFDSKGEARPLSYAESAPIRTKQFHVQKSETKTATFVKIDQTVRRSFETLKPSPSSLFSKEKMPSPRSEKRTTHNEEKSCGIDKKEIDPKELTSYAAEESPRLSETLNVRVSHFDVLILFIEIMKLFLKSQEQERLSRKQERALQLEHMQNMVENYKQQSKSLLTSSLGAGLFAIVSGITPIFGFLYGEQAVDLCGLLISRLRDMEKADRNMLFESITKITQTFSEVQKSHGEIQKTFAQSSLVFDQHMAEIHKADWEEDTRSMEAIKENWKNIENFLYQTLQMYHEAAQHLHK